MSTKLITAADWRSPDYQRHANDEQEIKRLRDYQRKWLLRQSEIADKATAENRNLKASEQRDFAAAGDEHRDLEAIVDEIQAEIDQRASLDEQRAPFDSIVRPPTVHGYGAYSGRSAKERGQEVEAFLNREIDHMEVSFRGLEVVPNTKDGSYEVRDLTVGSATGGGNTVPTTFHRDLYQHLVDASGIRQTNVRVITTDTGEDKIFPKTTSHGTAAIVGEGTALAEADPAFGKVTLQSWKYGELIEVTNELVTDSGVELLPYLAKQAGMALGYASDAHFMTGSGTNQPLGVFSAAGTAVTGATGGTGVPSVANLIDMYYSVAKPYRERAYWVMRDATASWIRKMTYSSTYPETWGDSLANGSPATLLGRPVVTSPFAPAMGTPACPIAFGDFSAYTIRDVKGVRFERSDDYKFANDMVAFRAILRTDGDLIDLTGAIKLFAGPST